MSPEMINFFFDIVFKKKVFTPHQRVPSTTGVAELLKKTTLPWKPMELGGVPQQDDESSPWDLYYILWM